MPEAGGNVGKPPKPRSGSRGEPGDGEYMLVRGGSFVMYLLTRRQLEEMEGDGPDEPPDRGRRACVGHRQIRPLEREP